MSKKGRIYYIRRKLQVLVYQITSAEFVSKIYFRHVLGYRLNLLNPQTFNEKLQWLKLYYWPENRRAIQCADKYTVRDYMKSIGKEMLLNDLLFAWDSVDEIDWNILPEKFALKCTHGCGYNIICDSKSELNIKYSKKQLKRWMKEDFGKFNAELHYSKMTPRIICEKYLGEDIVDYKFFCFHGEVKFMYIAQGFGKGVNEQISFFDRAGNPAVYRRTDYVALKNAKLPDKFDEMIEMSQKLSTDFPFVRVDWFEVNDKIYFGELTFTPCGGLMKIDPIEYDRKWGDMLHLEGLVEKYDSNKK